MSKGTYGTPYTETEMLMAVMQADEEYLAKLLAEALVGELWHLSEYTDLLAQACSRELRRRGEPIRSGHG